MTNSTDDLIFSEPSQTDIDVLIQDIQDGLPDLDEGDAGD